MLWLFLAALLFAGLAAIGAALWGKHAEFDDAGELAELAPQSTIVFLSLNDLNGLWDRFSKTEASRHWGDPADWILRALDAEAAPGATLDAHARRAVVARFARRWFGRHAAAIIFPLEGLDDPAIVVLAETRAGFEESLAELIAQAVPGLGLVKRQHLETTMFIYGEKNDSESGGAAEDDGFSYCRFEQTVAISLGAGGPRALQALIDRNADPAASSMADHPLFREHFLRDQARQGLHAFIDKTVALDALLRAEGPEAAKKDRANLEFCQRLFSRADALIARLWLADGDQQLRADCLLLGEAFHSIGAAQAAAAPANSNLPFSATPSLLPPGALFLTAGKSAQLSQLVEAWSFGLPEQMEIHEDIAALDAALREDFDLDLRGQILPLLSREIAFACTGARSGLMFPVPEAVILAGLSDPAAAAALLESAWGRYEQKRLAGEPLKILGLTRVDSGGDAPPRLSWQPLILPPIEIGIIGQWLAVGLGQGALDGVTARLDQTVGAGDTLASSDAFRQAGFEPASGAGDPFLIYADFPALHETLARLTAASAFWSKGLREDVASYAAAASTLQWLGPARLAVRPANGTDSMEVEFSSPLK